MRKDKITISLVGNPNCGKTTLFNVLTGARQRVGNWPGVTVEKKTGYFVIAGQKIDVVDLPGTYDIESDQTDIPLDESIARNFVLTDKDSVLVNIIDASSLQRNLYLTSQLLDLDRPMIIALNMMDSARLKGFEIDVALLQERLGCRVIPIIARKGVGIAELKKAIVEASITAPSPRISRYATLGAAQENMIADCLKDLPTDSVLHTVNTLLRVEAIQGIDNGLVLNDKELAALQACRTELGKPFAGEMDIALASARYAAIDELSRDVIKTVGVASTALTNRLDKWALGRITGIPVFLLIMFLMFVLAINIGSAFIDFFDILSGAVFVDGTRYVLGHMGAPDWLISVLANGAGAGIQTVATFVPVIAAMFLCLSFLEDSGYLARAAMVVDRGMQTIGLPGKAFVPMVVGFGCNVPAIMGTRTLESPRDRLMSIMMIPFMSCGARLPVYALFAAVFFPNNGSLVVYSLYLFGILIAILTGFALKYSILKDENTPFVMELPMYHLPTFRGLLALTWDRLKGFIAGAGKAIVVMVTILSFFNMLGTDGSFGNENSERSVLSSVSRAVTPVFAPMGIQEENWPATVGIFTGIFAKEAVIGTLNSLYAQTGEESEEEAYDLRASWNEAIATIPANLMGALENIADPLGIGNALASGDLAAVQADNEVDDTAVTGMQALFGSTAAVIAYLVFILLYTPCVAALGAVYREAGLKWTVLVACWTFALGWIFATGYYQISLLWAGYSGTAIAWLAGLVVLLIVLFMLLRRLGEKKIFSMPKHPIVVNAMNSGKRGCC